MNNNDQRQEYRLDNQLTVIIELGSYANGDPILVVSKSLDISANGLRAIASEAIDAMTHKGDIDFVRDFASRVSGGTIATLLGFERARWDQLVEWADRMWAAEGRTMEDPLVADIRRRATP